MVAPFTSDFRAGQVLDLGERVLAMRTAAVKGRTRVCCLITNGREVWVTFRSGDGKRLLKVSLQL